MAKAHLPTELWLDIARYLPRSQLLQLKSLNTVFFYAAMDIDWGQIEIDMSIPDQTDLVLPRIADPFVASRTTRLSVCLRNRSTPTHRPFRRPKLPSIISYVPFKRRESTSLEFANLMTQFLNVLPLLNNLTFLKLQLLLIPLDLVQDLFRTITTSPSTRKLEKLSLMGHLDVIAPLVECRNPEATFASLSALDITLICRDNGNQTKVEFDTNNIPSLARFILSLSLQHLKIVSFCDVSSLFDRLTQPLHVSSSPTPLSNLKSVMLTPLCNSFQYSPRSVHRFLLTHSTNIQHLQLSLRIPTWPPDDIDKVLEKWLSNFVNDSGYDPSNASPTKSSLFFPNLQTLDIHPPDTPAGLSAMLVFIKRIARTLTSLKIRCNLSIERAEQVVSTLTASKVKPNKLKSLQLNMSELKVSFIEFLAIKLPQLQKLYLRFYQSPAISDLSQKLFEMLLKDRRWLYVSAEDDCLTSWKLRHLTIKGIDKVNAAAAALAAFIPSVEQVLGDEDESEDEE